MHRGAGGIYTDDHPEEMLNRGLWDGNFFVTGENRSKVGSPYERNGLDTGYYSGYAGDTIPGQYHMMSQVDPSELMVDGNTASEEWGDMFLNWSMGGFNNSPRGQYYQTWMDDNMGSWIDLVGGG